MKNRKPIWIGLAVIVVVILAASIFLALGSNTQQSYMVKISEGQKYLEAGDYDQAIILFQAATAMDETKSDAYIWLYRAYLGAGYLELARSTLETGYLETNSISFQLMLEEFAAEQGYTVTLADPNASQTGTEASEKRVNPVLNRDLLSFFATANYGDYRMKYGGVQCSASGGVYTARADGLDAALEYYDTDTARVIDAANGAPYSNFLPNEISLDNITVLFGGATMVTYEELRTMSGITGLTKTENTVTFEAAGCKITIACDEDGTIRENAANTIIPTGTATSAAVHVLTGSIVDASTGAAVSGASVKAYHGIGAFGTPVEATSDSSGMYSLEVSESGNYTVVVSKEGYIEETFQVYITENNQTINQSFTISQELAGDEMRIVLTWGASPSDLDSYLIGRTDSGDNVFVFFADKTARDSGGNVIAELDVDDTTGYGPETITLRNINGVYEFAVADFTASGTMSSSGAQVKVYMGNTLVETIDICSGLENGWSVCKIDHGEVTVVNARRSTLSGMGVIQ